MTTLNRRRFLAVASAGVTAATAGCSGSALSNADDGSGDAGSEGGAEREITVSATGAVEADPDEATVSVGVEARGESAEDVTDELAAGAERLRTAFDELGIPEENVEEGRYRVGPVHGRDDDIEEIRGTRSFEVTVDDVDRVGEVIDAAVEAGADDVGRVNFTLQEDTRDELRTEALDEALANADEEAEHVAANRGVELTGTKAVTTNDVHVDPVSRSVEYETAEGDAAGGPPTEIDADPVSVSASVTVVYSFAE